MLTAVLGSSSMQQSVTAMGAFVSSWAADETLLNSQLYEPALGDAGTAEQLPVVLLRDFASIGSMHLRSNNSVGSFLRRLPRISFAGMAAPERSRVVDGRLVDAYAKLGDRVEQLSAGFSNGPGQQQQQQQQRMSQQSRLRLQHFSQIVFGRLDLAAAHVAVAAASAAVS
jgi:hypothetical protein